MTQCDLQFGPVWPRAGTQAETLLKALAHGQRLTVLIALEMYGVYALSQRIGELKRMGWRIDSRLIETSTGKHVAEYSLELAEVAA